MIGRDGGVGLTAAAFSELARCAVLVASELRERSVRAFGASASSVIRRSLPTTIPLVNAAPSFFAITLAEPSLWSSFSRSMRLSVQLAMTLLAWPSHRGLKAGSHRRTTKRDDVSKFTFSERIRNKERAGEA
jgi:hypothetical protein